MYIHINKKTYKDLKSNKVSIIKIRTNKYLDNKNFIFSSKMEDFVLLRYLKMQIQSTSQISYRSSRYFLYSVQP